MFWIELYIIDYFESSSPLNDINTLKGVHVENPS